METQNRLGSEAVKPSQGQSRLIKPSKIKKASYCAKFTHPGQEKAFAAKERKERID
jgi:hypothetical protein